MTSSMFTEPCACPYVAIGPSMADYCGGGAYLVFMSLLEAFINGRCDLNDPCNQVPPRTTVDNEYDFIVAGGGTAGAVVASRLSENPASKVLVIEGGGDETPASSVPSFAEVYLGNPEADWQFQTEPEENACQGETDHRCPMYRAKMLGGCSTHNAMLYVRGKPRDYANWVALGAKGWGWDDVLPYFLKSEDNRQIGTLVDKSLHRSGGYLTLQQPPYWPPFADDILDAGVELGYQKVNEINGAELTGFSIGQTTNRGGSRLSTARAFLRPAAHRSNLHVLLHAKVTRVLVDPATKVATGVEYLYNGTLHTVKASKEVILSAGVIQSPQLLLLSGIGPRETLTAHNISVVNELPGVGRNLWNHVGTPLSFTLEKENRTNQMNWATATQYLLSRNGPLSSQGLSMISGHINSHYADPAGDYPDFQIFFSGYTALCGTGDTGPENATTPDAKRNVTILPVYLHTKSRGNVTLKSADPNDPPLIYANYYTEKDDLKILLDGIKLALKFVDTKIMREKYGMTPTNSTCLQTAEYGTDEYLTCVIKNSESDSDHLGGTCKMGSCDDNMAVVDPHLKVIGVRGLRVIDASVMPAPPSGNTMAPTIMVAEKGSQHIKDDWTAKC